MEYIVVCGSLNMDFVCTGPRIPVAGETILGYDFTTTTGGKGGNQAAALAHLGVQTHMIGCVGNDAYGEMIIESLNRKTVYTDNILKVEKTTGTAHIMIDDTGENNIVVIPSANMMVSESLVMDQEVLISGAKVLLTQLEIRIETVEAFLNLGKKYNKFNILNPAPMPAEGLSEELLKLVDLLTPNETEMKQLTGINVVDEESFKQAAMTLHKKGVKNIICTMGANGAFFSDGEQVIFQKAFVVKAIDTTCAGDSFTGAVIVKLFEGNSIKEALTFAAKVSALTVMKKGAQESIPSREEVESFDFSKL